MLSQQLQFEQLFYKDGLCGKEGICSLRHNHLYSCSVSLERARMHVSEAADDISDNNINLNLFVPLVEVNIQDIYQYAFFSWCCRFLTFVVVFLYYRSELLMNFSIVVTWEL